MIHVVDQVRKEKFFFRHLMPLFVTVKLPLILTKLHFALDCYNVVVPV